MPLPVRDQDTKTFISSMFMAAGTFGLWQWNVFAGLWFLSILVLLVGILQDFQKK